MELSCENQTDDDTKTKEEVLFLCQPSKFVEGSFFVYHQLKDPWGYGVTSSFLRWAFLVVSKSLGVCSKVESYLMVKHKYSRWSLFANSFWVVLDQTEARQNHRF